MRLDTIVIELTRRCNMTCDHCCRGDAQDLDISDRILEKFFRNIEGEYVNCITLTGGEPGLVPDRIQAVLKYVRKYEVSVGYFYMVTNAKKVSDDFLIAIMDMYMQSEDKDMVAVSYSDDQFHSGDNEENIKKLSVFRFVTAKGGDIEESLIINEGRGGLNFSGHDIDLYPYRIDGDDTIEEGLFYLNCKGNILPVCDLSFETQDVESLILWNVENDFNLVELAEEFNKKIDTIGKTVEDFKYQLEFAS